MIAVLGCSLTGPAAASNAMEDPDVTAVLLCDRERLALADGQYFSGPCWARESSNETAH